MRTTLALMGSLAVVGLTRAAESPDPRQPAAAPRVVEQPKPAAGLEEKGVVNGVEAFSALYSAGNAEGLAELFLDDASITDPEGNETRGKAGIAEMYAAAFQESPGLKVKSKVHEVRFLTPDVARVRGESQLSWAAGDASEFNKFDALLVRRDGKWKIAEIRELVAPPADLTPHQRLQELEWLVGDWVNESDSSRVRASVRWADNHSYLIRTYTVEAMGQKSSSETSFIGWDPQNGQFKSWIFDSNGGHGEGLWTRTGDKEWVVKALGVLYDGRPTSVTQVHTIINKDSIKASSIDRVVGGQVAPDIADIVMLRKTPSPGAAAPAFKPAPVTAKPK